MFFLTLQFCQRETTTSILFLHRNPAAVSLHSDTRGPDIVLRTLTWCGDHSGGRIALSLTSDVLIGDEWPFTSVLDWRMIVSILISSFSLFSPFIHILHFPTIFLSQCPISLPLSTSSLPSSKLSLSIFFFFSLYSLRSAVIISFTLSPVTFPFVQTNLAGSASLPNVNSSLLVQTSSVFSRRCWRLSVTPPQLCREKNGLKRIIVPLYSFSQRSDIWRWTGTLTGTCQCGLTE